MGIATQKNVKDENLVSNKVIDECEIAAVKKYAAGLTVF